MSPTLVDLMSPPMRKWRALLPSRHARCYRCRRTWEQVAPHRVTPGAEDARRAMGKSHDEWRDSDLRFDGRIDGQFALCEHCWDSASIETRLLAHKWLCRRVQHREPFSVTERLVLAEIVADWQAEYPELNLADWLQPGVLPEVRP